MKRCLIEIDNTITTGMGGQYTRFIDDLNGITIEEFFNTIVVDALNNKKEVWKSIVESDEIWVNTCYIGESGRFLTEFLILAQEQGIKDKTLININNYENISLPQDAFDILDEMFNNNNIKIIYNGDEEFIDYLPK